jgi:BirA family biotin operon repressor/biotin-[acetyl-CoA-carboxylase] ligase
VTTGTRLTGAVLGIGINVNWLPDQMPDEISQSAASLASLAGREVDRVALLSDLLDALDEEIGAVEAGRSPLDRYRRECVTLGATVTVDTAAGLVRGRAVALDDIGALVVETDSGRTSLSSGEVVSVRGDTA